MVPLHTFRELYIGTLRCRYLALQLSGNIWPAELVGHLTHPVLLARHPFYFGDYFDSYPSSKT